ncbi:MAG: elongation factor Tu, partial [Bacteroidia bacterium]|nr:elongation factor Tu [Bacteroidia bacterium]
QGDISVEKNRINKAVDEESFLMPVEDVFGISGMGTVVTGRIERGTIKAGDPVEVIGLSNDIIKSKVIRIELFNKSVAEANKGDNVGLVLNGVDKSTISRGMVICKPGSLKAYTEFKCQINLKTKDEGGRSTPVFDKYRPQFSFRTAIVSGEITLPKGMHQMKPGENALVSVKLSTPVALESNMDFSLREGSRIVGAGRITELLR